MNKKYDNRHLSLEDRRKIEEGIEKGFTNFKLLKL